MQMPNDLEKGIIAATLSSDEARLTTVVERYKNLCQRASEIESGRQRVAWCLLAVMRLRDISELNGLQRSDLEASLPA